MSTTALSTTELLRCLLGLGVVLFLLLLLSYCLKKISGFQGQLREGFQLLATYRLGTKEKLTLVKVGGRYLLLGCGAGQINLLYDFGETIPYAFEEQKGASFSTLLQSWTVQ